jgi:hypothetical protein
VTAVDPSSPKKEGVTLQAFALKQKPRTISIRPVQVRGPSGKKDDLVYHSELLRNNGFDPQGLLDKLNTIYTPQTGIVFSLGDTSPAKFTDEARIAKILQVQDATARLPDKVDLDRFGDMFKELRDRDAHFTLFLVKGVLDLHGQGPRAKPDEPNGVASAEDKQGLVGDESVPYFWVRTIAHETGHYAGSMTGRDGKRLNFPDLYNDANLLMRTGGSGCKIPLAHVITGSAFNAGY